MLSILHTAQYLVNLLHEAGYTDVSPMKLQKVLFYAKAWGLVSDVPFAVAPVHKWTRGPVNITVWEHYHHAGDHGRHAIIPPAWLPDQVKLHVAQQQLAELVIHSYGPISALTLSAMTHREAPWQQTPKDTIIPDALIKDYYSQQAFAQNFPIDFSGKPYVAPPSDALAAFTMDMSRQDAEQFKVYDSFLAYREYLGRARGEITESWLSDLLA